jgi:hypothetical protein
MALSARLGMQFPATDYVSQSTDYFFKRQHGCGLHATSIRPGEENAQGINTHERRQLMPLINLVIVLVVVGVVLWVINSYIPMQATIKKILNVVVVVAVIVWLLSVFGLIGNISTIRIGK